MKILVSLFVGLVVLVVVLWILLDPPVSPVVLKKQLADTQRRIREISDENDRRNRLNIMVAEGAVDVGTTQAQERHERRQSDLAHNRRLIHQLLGKEMRLKKKLGIA